MQLLSFKTFLPIHSDLYAAWVSPWISNPRWRQRETPEGQDGIEAEAAVQGDPGRGTKELPPENEFDLG